jgi:PRTRC genetic system protein A
MERAIAMLDARDAALQQSCPVVAAPRYGVLPPMDNGQRIVIARNGIFVQVKRDWLDCMERIGVIDPRLPLPYGDIKPAVNFSFGVIPMTLLQDFITAGRAALPFEIAGGLIYAAYSTTLRLQLYEPISNSPDKIDYRMPMLLQDESVCVDLHTHGRDRAFFSPMDDVDDRSVKVAGVFGNLDQPQPSAAFRLVINGFYVPLAHPWQLTSEDVESAERQLTLDSMGFAVRK